MAGALRPRARFCPPPGPLHESLGPHPRILPNRTPGGRGLPQTQTSDAVTRLGSDPGCFCPPGGIGLGAGDCFLVPAALSPATRSRARILHPGLRDTATVERPTRRVSSAGEAERQPPLRAREPGHCGGRSVGTGPLARASWPRPGTNQAFPEWKQGSDPMYSAGPRNSQAIRVPQKRWGILAGSRGGYGRGC